MPRPPRYILCVDDDADDLLFITSALQQVYPALHITVANHGVEALRHLEQMLQSGTPPCLITLDINMPRMDGKETLAALKHDPRFASLPVVVFSTSGSAVDRLFCTRYGVELVTKPDRYEDVVRVVQSLFRSVLNSSDEVAGCQPADH